MSLIGAEIGEMHALKSSFTHHSGQVEQLIAALRGELGSTWWRGGAAERFRNAWDTEYEPALRGLARALLDASDEIGRRAEDIHRAGG
jgi:uncharacterized protein YukE